MHSKNQRNACHKVLLVAITLSKIENCTNIQFYSPSVSENTLQRNLINKLLYFYKKSLKTIKIL